MKWTMNRIALIGVVLLAVGLGCSIASAQNQTVKVDLHFDMYDVVMLTDFVDLKNNQLAPNISGISLNLSSPGSQPSEYWVCVNAELYVKLGSGADQQLMYVYTNNFDMMRYPTLGASNFTQTGNVRIRDGMDTYWENKDLRKTLEDMASKTGTAPPGKYTIIMKVWHSATSNNPNEKGIPTNAQVVGSDQKTISVSFSTADEAFVEITDPKPGSFSNNVSPTFSWTSSVPAVKVSVYEALVSHHSPQDAINGGSPYLVLQNYDPAISSYSSFTSSLNYPANATRKLEQEKAYVVQVDARVITSRERNGVFRPSIPIVFRITNDNVGTMLANFLNTFSISAFETLRNDPNNWVAWSPYGNITLDNSTITETDLRNLINDLAARNDLTVQLSVENQ
jgi:hypothetical protein